MTRTWAWLLVTAGLALGAPAAALAALPECAAADKAALPNPGTAISSPGLGQGDAPVGTSNESPPNENPPEFGENYGPLSQGMLTGEFDLPIIDYPFDTEVDAYGFILEFVVDTDGRVTCASIDNAFQNVKRGWNPQRKAFLQVVAGWRFKPYRLDGKPSAAVGSVRIEEDELPRVHVPMPKGDPRQVVIVHDMPAFGYHLELHGDGSAVYSSLRRGDYLGPQAYHVDPAAVAEILKQAEEADFWSLRDVYPRRTKDTQRMSRIEITLGGKTKSLTDDGNPGNGLTTEAGGLEYGIRHIADVDFWWHPGMAAIAQLKTNGFDFKSEAAGRLLMDMMGDTGVPDDAVLALMALGAPRDTVGNASDGAETRTLIEEALGAGRTQIAGQLIADGALLTAGKADPAKVDRAFLAAIGSCNLAALDLILPFHPAMTYADREAPGVQISVFFRLANPGVNTGEWTVMAQRLLDLGADVNARRANGETLLHDVLATETYTVFLLDHGADINAVDKAGKTPLAKAFIEEAALLLVERGADPRVGRTPPILHERLKNGTWPRLRAWLLAHGYGDILAAKAGEDAPEKTP